MPDMNISPLSTPQPSVIDRHFPHTISNQSLSTTLSNSGALDCTSELERVTSAKHPTVPLWPDEPQTLQRGGWLAALSCLGDVIVILTSITFIIFGSFVVHYDQVPITEVPHISILKDAARYVGHCIFPSLSHFLKSC